MDREEIVRTIAETLAVDLISTTYVSEVRVVDSVKITRHYVMVVDKEDGKYLVTIEAV